MPVSDPLRSAVVTQFTSSASVLAVSGSLRGLLYGVAPIDSTTVLAVASLIAIVAIAAASVPAWRAARVDPTTALRAE
jgi:ABC-type antimicrobial peptide transport system permease subunit